MKAKVSVLLIMLANSVWAAPKMIIGTGFFYNHDGDFFTNRHVLENCRPETIRAKTSDGVWSLVALISLDKEYDLAAGTVNRRVEEFASIRVAGNSGFVSVPRDIEDIFSAGFSAPERNNFKLQTKWGQVQSSVDPNERPFVQRMRMDAYPGASGSPILDYSGLLVGILFAGSRDPVTDSSLLSRVGYGDRWIYFYNNNAVVEFANKNRLSYSSWGNWERKSPTFIAEHARRITLLISCESDDTN